MPIALVRSISLPNLKIYTTISLLLVSGCFYYAFDTVRTDPQWKLHQNSSHNYAISRSSSIVKQQQQSSAMDDVESESLLTNGDILDEKSKISVVEEQEDEEEKLESSPMFDEINQNETSTLVSQLKDVIQFMTHEPICIWVRFLLSPHNHLYVSRHFDCNWLEEKILISSTIMCDVKDHPIFYFSLFFLKFLLYQIVPLNMKFVAPFLCALFQGETGTNIFCAHNI